AITDPFAEHPRAALGVVPARKPVPMNVGGLATATALKLRLATAPRHHACTLNVMCLSLRNYRTTAQRYVEASYLLHPASQGRRRRLAPESVVQSCHRWFWQ